MFDLSFSEILVILVVAVLFIGPKELPTVIRAVAKAGRVLADFAGEVRAMFREVAEESGVEQLQQDIKDEVKLIQGDDGMFYEAYDVDDALKDDASRKQHG